MKWLTAQKIERRLDQLAQAPAEGPHAMVLLLARSGIGVKRAGLLVHEVLSRNMRDRRAVARYSGLSPARPTLVRSGNARVRRGMIQLAGSSYGCIRAAHSPNGIGSERRLRLRRARRWSWLWRASC